MADFIGVDFFDGTGPGALPPNDVARALRVAKDNASTARLSRGVRGRRDNDQLEGKEASLGRRRQCVVHVESATTGAFFKVSEGCLLIHAESKSGGGMSSQAFLRRDEFSIFGKDAPIPGVSQGFNVSFC